MMESSYIAYEKHCIVIRLLSHATWKNKVIKCEVYFGAIKTTFDENFEFIGFRRLSASSAIL